jgi:phage-related baseplate assembly protein
MPNFASPALYIDFSRLPPPQVIEEIDFEILLQRYKDDVLAKNPKLAAALALEQSPTNVILEAESYGETLVRARVNAAARAVLLALSSGNDLEHLAAFFGVVRGTILGDPLNPNGPVDIPESDESLRRRAQLAPEAFSTAGSEGAYIFHALTSDVSIRDASAQSLDRYGNVAVTIMNSGSDPTPTPAQISNVVSRLNQKNIKPLTDVVIVKPVTVIRRDIVAELTLYPGPDASRVMSDVQAALTKVRNRISLIGRDLTRSSIISALNQEGVQSVNLKAPADNVPADASQCVLITSASINVVDPRME